MEEINLKPNGSGLTLLPKELIPPVWDVIERPIVAINESKKLWQSEIDHIALALKSKEELIETVQFMRLQGAVTMLKTHRWPNEIPYCPAVSLKFQKWMAVMDIGNGWIVLLAPVSKGDLIDQTYHSAGEPTVHHVAYRVDNLNEARQEILKDSRVAQISAVAQDPGKLDQVFMAVDEDVRILELVQRYPGFVETFTCQNITTLTEGEAKHERHRGGEE